MALGDGKPVSGLLHHQPGHDQDAILEALVRDVPHPNAVRLALERQREQLGTAPPVAIVLPVHLRDRDAPVRPHALETYDQLKETKDAAKSDD